MHELRKARVKKGLAAAEVARGLGISAPRLAAYEDGSRLPSPPRLAQWLDVLGLAKDAVALPGDFLDSYPGEYELQVDQEQSWATVVPGYHLEYQEMDPTLKVPEWFRAAVRVDSGLEALAWMQLAHRPTRFVAASPVRAGFRKHQLATGAREPLGALAKACFSMKNVGLSVMLWPQVTLQMGGEFLRVDGLVRVQRRGLFRWQVIEIDGEQHWTRSERDRRREARIDLPHHRFSAECVRGWQFREQLLDRLVAGSR